MFVICLIISYKYTNNLPISQLLLYFFYPELTLVRLFSLPCWLSCNQ